MKDLIIGCFNRYAPEVLAPLVNSIDRSGFSGDKLAVAYGHENGEDAAVAYLKSKGWITEHYPTFTKLIVVCRFRDIASFLTRHRGYRYIISVDMGDVVFQSNPSLFLEQHMGDKKYLAGSECIRYKDEISWGGQNLNQSFPEQASRVMPELIMNAGTFAADAEAAIPLCTKIFDMSMRSPVGNPDQAALNVCLRLDYSSQTHFMNMRDGWAIQLNTVGNPDLLSVFGNSLTEKEFCFKDGIGYVEGDKKAVLIHQYNHVPGLWDQIKRHYL